MLLNILKCTGWFHIIKDYLNQISIASSWRNLGAKREEKRAMTEPSAVLILKGQGEDEN